MQFLALSLCAFFAGIAAESAYAPVSVACPATSLVRHVSSTSQLSAAEDKYRTERKFVADLSLRIWLIKNGLALSVLNEMPTIALTSSGGGFRAQLTGAGVVQALDARDTNVGTSGLYQALTYHAGLSGGSWLLSSIASNDNAAISTLLKTWTPALENGLFDPTGSTSAAAFTAINNDLADKKAAGFSGTVTDVWSRLLSYILLPGTNGGASNRLSGVASLTSYALRLAPYPIILAQHVDLNGTSCVPGANAPFWEFTPYEFGSWDSQIAAFTPISTLGSNLSGGKPVSQSECINGFDNVGFVLGTSSALFNDPGIGTDVDAQIANFCQIASTGNVTGDAELLAENVAALPTEVPELTLASVSDLFASYPNPFYNYANSPLVSDQKNLSLVDGGQSGQINPIFPFLQPARAVDVIIVNDNDANTAEDYTDGSGLLNTYNAAKAAGLTRMPYIPSVATIAAQNLTSRPTFFGCGNSSVATIVWIPNGPYTKAGGGTATDKMTYTAAETTNMIANGAAAMSQNGSDAWAKCLGCAIMQKSASNLPSSCNACFSKYCFED